MKNDWMQIKMKQFDFCETRFHKTFFDCASTFVQTKKKLFDWKWVERTQFYNNFEREIEFTSNKNEMSGRVKLDSL